MAISVLGVMVAVPAKGAIPSTKYIQEAINNMSTPAGSVITGYGSVDGVQPYLLAGTGDGSAGWLSYSDLVSGLSGYLKGSQISGYGMGTGSEASYLLAGSNTTGSPFFVSVSNLGSRIGGYGYYNGNGSMILAGSGYGEAKWMSTYGLAAGLGSLIGSYLTYVPGSKVMDYGNMSAQSSGGYLLVGTGTGSAGWLDYSRFGADIGGYMTGIKGSAIWWDTTTGSAAFILAGSETGKWSKASWLSYEDLASGLSPYLGGGGGASVPAGSVITGYGSVDGVQPYLLAGTGDGSAGWMLWSTLLTGIGGPISSLLSGSVIRFTGSTSTGAYVFAGGSYAGTGAWLSYSNLAAGLGSYLGSYILGSFVSGINGSNVSWYGSWSSASHVLAGTGSGIAAWMSYNNLAAGLGSLIGSYIPGSYLSGIRGSVVTGYGSMSYASHVLVGSGGSSAAYWMSYSGLASGLGSYLGAYVIGSYLSGIRGSVVTGYGSMSYASHVLVGSGGSSAAHWMSYYDLASGLGSVLGSKVAGYGYISSGSYLLAGSGSGSAGWMSYYDLASVLGSVLGSQITGYRYISGGSLILAGNGGSAGWLSYTALAPGLGSYIGSYISGSAVTGYGRISSGSYVLAGSGSGSAGWIEMSGLGSQIKFEETATAAELQANTGTIYFPVIQSGKVYGVTANDFYILMNAGQ